MENENYLKELGGRIKALRLMNGWTQKELAQKCGYGSYSSNSTVTKIENGMLNLSILRLKDIADVFKVSVSYLIGEDMDNVTGQEIARRNALMIMKKKLSEDEQKELMKGLEIFFASKQTDTV